MRTIRTVAARAAHSVLLTALLASGCEPPPAECSVGEAHCPCDTTGECDGERPRSRVVVLTMHAEDRYAMRVLRAGADGYLTKGRSSDELLLAIRAVAKGGKYLTPQLSAVLLDALAHGSGPPHEALSNRELDVLVMLGRGMTPSDIATALGLSSSTVSTHLRRIKSKLGLRSNGELVQYAVREGLVGS